LLDGAVSLLDGAVSLLDGAGSGRYCGVFHVVERVQGCTVQRDPSFTVMALLNALLGNLNLSVPAQCAPHT
jgi:hypothetical protein